MHRKHDSLVRWFLMVWVEDANETTRKYRKHVRGLIVGWAITAVAMVLIERFPNEGALSMYALLRTSGLPWQQHWLAAIEIAAPLLMVWHLGGLKRSGRRQQASR